MSEDNKINFMSESNAHVSNMNRALKNIKSDIVVNFIHADNVDIIAVTNNITLPLDLQTIR